jgi:hypothetical protein
MNAHIANLILAKIVEADLPWLDKYAGLTRTTSILEGKTRVVLPISCAVEDPLACGDSTMLELVPDDKYSSVLFIEGDPMPERITDRVLGVSYRSRLRIVVWLNCSKLGGDCNCGSQASINLISAIEQGNRNTYSTEFFRSVRHKVMGGATLGPDVFSRYTFNEDRIKYLHFPFDCFALDIETEVRVLPGCEDQLLRESVECWTPPTTGRRLHPREFTCEQLTDATNGLTDAQLECLDCSDGTACTVDVVINVDGVEVDTVTGIDPCEDQTFNITITYS